MAISNKKAEDEFFINCAQTIIQLFGRNVSQIPILSHISKKVSDGVKIKQQGSKGRKGKKHYKRTKKTINIGEYYIILRWRRPSNKVRNRRRKTDNFIETV